MKVIFADGIEQEIALPPVPRMLIIRRKEIGVLLMAIPLVVWCKRNLQAKITLVVEHGSCKTSVDRWSPLSVSAECLFHSVSASEIPPAAIAESVS